MPHVSHPIYPLIQAHLPQDLHDLIAQQVSFADYQRLPDILGITPAWLGRKLASPNQFTVAEATKLAQLLNMQVSDLALHYAVGLDEMTAGDILNILLAEGHMTPYAAAAAPTEAIAEDGGRTVAKNATL